MFSTSKEKERKFFSSVKKERKGRRRRTRKEKKKKKLGRTSAAARLFLHLTLSFFSPQIKKGKKVPSRRPSSSFKRGSADADECPSLAGRGGRRQRSGGRGQGRLRGEERIECRRRRRRRQWRRQQRCLLPATIIIVSVADDTLRL
jgi:hypothetical protein